MKKRHTFFLIIILIVSGLCAAYMMSRPKNTVAQVNGGTLDRYPEFQSKYIKARDVAVWLPEGYKPGEPCDVLYMHDGQMLFDSTTTWNHQEWCIDEVMSRLISEGRIRRCMVVAINNTDDRLGEYFPSKTSQYVPEDQRKRVDVEDFAGDAYLQFVVKELKPFIDEHYRPLTTREHTFMMGSSMGGLISLYALCEYPEVFGGVACLSSHLSMGYLGINMKQETWATAFRDYLEAHLPPANESLVYMDRGTEDFDADYGPYQSKVDVLFRNKGWDDAHYVTRVYNGDEHKETCWAKRVHIPLQLLLAQQAESQP